MNTRYAGLYNLNTEIRRERGPKRWNPLRRVIEAVLVNLIGVGWAFLSLFNGGLYAFKRPATAILRYSLGLRMGGRFLVLTALLLALILNL